jgi:hypothetical protein
MAEHEDEIGTLRERLIATMKGRVGEGLTPAGTRRVREELADALLAEIEQER